MTTGLINSLYVGNEVIEVKDREGYRLFEDNYKATWRLRLDSTCYGVVKSMIIQSLEVLQSPRPCDAQSPLDMDISG